MIVLIGTTIGALEPEKRSSSIPLNSLVRGSDRFSCIGIQECRQHTEELQSSRLRAKFQETRRLLLRQLGLDVSSLPETPM